MKKIAVLIISAIMLSCSSSDDGGGRQIGGPTGGGPDGGGPDGGGGGPVATTEYLKDQVSYPIGNIVSASKLSSSSSTNATFKTVLLNDFNSITAENDMKPSNMFIGPDNYNWGNGDAIVEYAKANGLRVHGHVLAWHNQQPGWFNTFSGTNEEFETAVLNYITATVSHFAEVKDDSGKSVVASWDVVNEAFEAAASSNVLYTKIDDFIAKAFIAARAGDPDVKLFYNDFNVAGNPAKRSNIIAMVNDFKSRATPVPIDGLGMQMHLNHDWPTDDLPASISDIASTGLLVHISELDVKVNYNNDISSLTAERAQSQADQYQRAAYYYNTLVPAGQRFGITIWGMRDQDSWLYNGGTEWPLLFDNNFDEKEAYSGFSDGLNGVAIN